jgi:hypothetical protein
MAELKNLDVKRLHTKPAPMEAASFFLPFRKLKKKKKDIADSGYNGGWNSKGSAPNFNYSS